MSKLEFKENKILKLTNVLSRKVPSEEIFSQDKQLTMLMSWIKAKGYETVGPLVIYSSGITGVDADGQPMIDSRIMVQLKQNTVRLELPYKFDKEIKVTNCNMARFSDDSDKLQFASNKISLHAYENDITLTGETYMVMIKQEESKLLCDVFMPIKNQEQCEVKS